MAHAKKTYLRTCCDSFWVVCYNVVCKYLCTLHRFVSESFIRIRPAETKSDTIPNHTILYYTRCWVWTLGAIGATAVARVDVWRRLLPSVCGPLHDINNDLIHIIKLPKCRYRRGRQLCTMSHLLIWYGMVWYGMLLYISSLVSKSILL